MSNINENPVPSGPPDLCFESSAFLKETFQVDEFLQDHRNKANLETMRDDLGIYLKVLRSAMIDLINKDYADFVNLSSNLIGLDKAINRIQVPLGQLKEELLQVRHCIDGAMTEITSHLYLRQELRERKRSLRSLSRVHTSLKKLKSFLVLAEETFSLEVLTLERAVAEYTQLQFHATRCQEDISNSDLKDLEKVGHTLVCCVDQLFMESLSTCHSDRHGLFLSLSLYHSLNKLDVAERLYKQTVVSPAMEQLINEDSLRSFPRGLPTLYSKIINFVKTDMKELIEVSVEFNETYSEDKCNFFLNSFWPEVEERLSSNLTSIYAVGDPDVFYERYRETLEFLEELSKVSNSSTLIQQLYSHPNFINFMERWNLPVYFQIRFQEIVKTVERAFGDENWNAIKLEWKLLASETTWDCLNRCWEPGIYLMPIAHKFWKLSLQIISRYTIWCNEIIVMTTPPFKIDVNFLVFLYTDIEKFLEKLPLFQTHSISRLPRVSENIMKLLHNSLDESLVKLKSLLGNVSKAIIKHLAGDKVSLLRQVNDIPRLFRRTNRESPSKPCSYVASILEGPGIFYQQHGHHPQSGYWLKAMFSNITKHYYSSVADVLNSVQKTEESLRRLKKARDRASNVAAPSDRRAADDNKIRQQLLLDVHAYHRGIEEFGIQKGSVDNLADLLLLVEASQKM
ncbi:conserved oligomeric Golgi complex subunit 2 isoform X2 [Rhodnius prolixus]|uniref:conserved oligomeric Golgi complex subunit 2 isoform X2 n=1 Tax=Rhodnius prolixus TaxID=13249 RepID=UPI003D18C986